MPFSAGDIIFTIIMLILFVVLPRSSFRLPKRLKKLEEKLEEIPISGRTVKIMGWMATGLGMTVIIAIIVHST